MRIVILADPLDNQQAGIHHYTRQLVSHLAKFDQKDEYYILRRKKDDLFPHDRQIIVKNYHFPGYAAIRMFVLIPRKLKRMKADVVVEPAHFGPFNLPKKIKRVTVIHDLTPIIFPKLHRYHSQLLQKIFLGSILKRASLIITNSDNTSRDVEKYYPGFEHKTRRIYLGRDEGISHCKNPGGAEKYSGAKQYFFFTGTIEPRKNLETLLKAFTIFKDKSKAPHILLIAGGKGWKSKAFFNQLKDHPYQSEIILCGYVERKDMPSLYSHAEAFVFPSLYEGFGLPVVEALSCGTPCLLSDSSSLPEVGGNAALYFKALDENTLAEDMINITDDKGLREELSKNAINQSKKFCWKDYVTNFDALIKKLPIA